MQKSSEFDPVRSNQREIDHFGRFRVREKYPSPKALSMLGNPSDFSR
jgi:hypothetical protein